MIRRLHSLLTRAVESVIVLVARFVTAPRIILDAPLEAGRVRVLYANHTSNADTILIWAALPPELRRGLRPVAAADYWLSSRIRRFVGLDVFRILPIERHAEGRRTDPVERMAEAIDAGTSLVIFPEGRRNLGPERLLPFKTGLYHLSNARPEIDLVPVWLENLNGVLPKGERVPVPLICTLSFGPALRVAPGEEKDAFLARATQALLAQSPDGVSSGEARADARPSAAPEGMA